MVSDAYYISASYCNISKRRKWTQVETVPVGAAVPTCVAREAGRGCTGATGACRSAVACGTDVACGMGAACAGLARASRRR
jgi:hypothetical protein